MKWPDDYINKVICGDCLEVMKGIPDGAVDCVVTDPPYGIGIVSGAKPSGTIGGSKPFGSGGGSNIIQANIYPKVHGDDKPFDPQAILKQFPDKPIVLFGANYYAHSLPETSSWFFLSFFNAFRIPWTRSSMKI